MRASPVSPPGCTRPSWTARCRKPRVPSCGAARLSTTPALRWNLPSAPSSTDWTSPCQVATPANTKPVGSLSFLSFFFQFCRGEERIWPVASCVHHWDPLSLRPMSKPAFLNLDIVKNNGLFKLHIEKHKKILFMSPARNYTYLTTLKTKYPLDI